MNAVDKNVLKRYHKNTILHLSLRVSLAPAPAVLVALPEFSFDRGGERGFEGSFRDFRRIAAA